MIEFKRPLQVSFLEMRRTCADAMSFQHIFESVIDIDCRDTSVYFTMEPTKLKYVADLYFRVRRIPYPGIYSFFLIVDLLKQTFTIQTKFERLTILDLQTK